MTYILILFLTYVLHLLLKLNWVCTAVVLVFLLVMQHFHRIKGQRFQEARKRFLDVSLYIDTLLYSFLKEQKIIRAFEDVKSTLADGHMKETVSRAIDHMMLTFDETEVFVDAMRIIEDEYKCNRIVNAHEFMAHAEYYGGDIKESARILLKDKSAWERRILRNIEDRQRMFHQIILSVVTSVIISGIILYLPVLSMDISSNIIVQILSVALIVLDDLIILWGQKFLEVDYLGIDLLPEDDKHAKKLEEYKAYNPAKELRASILMAVIPALASVFLLYTDRQWAAVAAMGAALICLNQHRIGHRLMKKNLIGACAERICVVVLFLWIWLYKRRKTDGAFNRRIGRKRYYASFRQWRNRCACVCFYSAVIVTELIKKYVKVRKNERSIQTVWRRADCSGRHKCISRVDGEYCAGSGRHACSAYKYMG